MEESKGPEMSPPADFRLAEWLVQPRLNRLSRGDRVVQIEPKMMDVLVFLADNAGTVVSKQQITDAVWPDLFITEAVITRSVAGLRRALGDDARQPKFIETILKRGYRLIAQVSAPPAVAAPQKIPTSLLRSTEIAEPKPAPVPYVVGQWVRGDTFYGREREIAEVLDGNRNWLWLLGTRRVGKTSLLKQLEHIAAASPERGFFPIFWDLQGADTPEELHADFGDALLDAEERFQGIGINLAEVRTDDLFDSLGRLRRSLRARNLKLLLLCDEVEELIQLGQQDPALLRKLRRAMQSREAIRSVLASSVRLWQLADAAGDTSPFLDGFTPPIYVGPLRDEDASEVVRQTGLPADVRPAFTDEEIDRIRDSCGNQPYLIQLLCRRALERNDLDEAIDEIATDRSVSFFFSVDFELLSGTERAILCIIAEHPSATLTSIRDSLPDHSETVSPSLKSLQNLGLVRGDRADRLVVANDFFRRWLVDTAGAVDAQ
jgi:DNA-binding winged helix-turn-helix (wHTH) protein